LGYAAEKGTRSSEYFLVSMLPYRSKNPDNLYKILLIFICNVSLPSD
jgi:hypothetical protein